MKNILGIDIGGTKIFHCLVNEKGELQGEVKKESTPKNLVDIENKLKEIISSYENSVDYAGIATAGAVSSANDKILGSTANLPLGYKDINFLNLSSKIKVAIENDANCSALAEHSFGVTKGYKNSIVLTLGTGVGGGIIINNELLKGKSGAAGEMHFKMSVDKKRLCTCGSCDCFEIYASGKGLQLTYQDFTGNLISTYEIIEKYKNNDDNAVLALKKWSEYIAIGLLGLNNIFDTDIFALSGSMAEFADIEFIEKYVNKYTLTSKTSVKKGIMGNYSGLIGATSVVRRKFRL